MRLKIGFSPCPNDTFIMYGIYGNKIGHDFQTEFFVEDVEALNQKALEGLLDMAKVSFGVVPFIGEAYEILSSGAAMGFGCGPLLIGKDGLRLSDLRSSRIGSPGRYTTARALLEIYGGRGLQIVDTTYERIIPGIMDGSFEMGLLIHESRFVVDRYPLRTLIDLGNWWEARFSLPIPLGGFVIKRELGIKRELEGLIKRSLRWAYDNFEETMGFCRLFAQETDPQIIGRHISLYVNEYTYEMGDLGRRAVEYLLAQIVEGG